MEEKLNETNVEAARVSPDGGFQLIKVLFIPKMKGVKFYEIKVTVRGCNFKRPANLKVVCSTYNGTL